LFGARPVPALVPFPVRPAVFGPGLPGVPAVLLARPFAEPLFDPGLPVAAEFPGRPLPAVPGLPDEPALAGLPEGPPEAGRPAFALPDGAWAAGAALAGAALVSAGLGLSLARAAATATEMKTRKMARQICRAKEFSRVIWGSYKD